MKIIGMTSKEIEAAMRNITRIYFVGNLQRPQALNFVRDNNLEIGISEYVGFTVEKPHMHTNAYEYQYVVAGYTEYMDVESGEIYSFAKGDFYYIPTGVKYAQKSAAGTKIIFIKVPSINDKVLVDETEAVKEWYKVNI